MKIDGNLRSVIKSAEKCQPSSNWEQSKKEEVARIQTLATSETNGAKFKVAMKKLAQYQSLQSEASKAFEELGLSSYGNTIRDEKKFLKAGGGKCPVKHARWKTDQVIAQVAEAKTDKAAIKILAEYGINWT